MKINIDRLATLAGLSRQNNSKVLSEGVEEVPVEEGQPVEPLEELEDDLENVFESRTFCLYEDIDKLKKLNLGLGGSLDNAIVIKNDKILNDSGLRNKLEFVNHKILDCMGDLFLSG